MPQLYDLTILLDADAPEDRRSAAVAEVHKLIGASGELVGEHDWGVRRMAYEIDHHAEAEYRLFQFNGEPDLLDRLRHSLKIMDGVLRHRIIRLKAGSPPPPPPREPAPRPREEREPEGRVAARAAADAPLTDEDAAAARIEAPPEAPGEPTEAPAEAPTETPTEAPSEIPAEPPADIPAEAPPTSDDA